MIDTPPLHPWRERLLTLCACVAGCALLVGGVWLAIAPDSVMGAALEQPVLPMPAPRPALPAVLPTPALAVAVVPAAPTELPAQPAAEVEPARAAEAPAAEAPAAEAEAPATEAPQTEEQAAAAATKRSPGDGRVLAMAQLQHQRPWRALATVTAFLEEHPHDIDALFIKGLCFFELKKDRAARILVDRVLLARPRHAMANLLRGFMDQQNHQSARALAHYRRYLGKAPNGRYADEVFFISNQLTPGEGARAAPSKGPSALAKLEPHTP